VLLVSRHCQFLALEFVTGS